MRVLITGITGFIGRHLAERLAAEGGHAVAGLSRGGGRVPGAEVHGVDLHDGPAVERLVREVRPDWVFHLAGYASPGKSYREPDRCWADNLGATRSLLAAVARAGARPRVVVASTGLVYGAPAGGDEAYDEAAPLRPASPYAASKAAADLAAYQHGAADGAAVVRARLFNQVGPGQSAEYAVANFARQVAAAEAGRGPGVVETGDLGGARDLSDVRDVAAAFRLLAERGAAGEAYNVGSGRALVMRDVLARLCRLARVRVDVRERPDPARPPDPGVARAAAGKLRALGWEPRYDVDRTLADTLEYWRGVAARD